MIIFKNMYWKESIWREAEKITQVHEEGHCKTCSLILRKNKGKKERKLCIWEFVP